MLADMCSCAWAMWWLASIFCMRGQTLSIKKPCAFLLFHSPFAFSCMSLPGKSVGRVESINEKHHNHRVFFSEQRSITCWLEFSPIHPHLVLKHIYVCMMKAQKLHQSAQCRTEKMWNRKAAGKILMLVNILRWSSCNIPTRVFLILCCRKKKKPVASCYVDITLASLLQSNGV